MKLDSQSKLRALRRKMIEVASSAKEGHLPSSLSILDLLWVLYSEILQIDPKNPTAHNRDRFILSKGHASLGLYAVLSEFGFFDVSELSTFGKFSSRLGGHPDTTKVPGAEASTGSLGHGFPMAVGAALAMKIQKNPAKVFCIVGDGECNEGSIWESALIASHHKLDNLTCIVDFNHSTDRALQLGDLVKKFESFGWKAISINGHDHEEIRNAFTQNEKPLAIIAETIKGYGCKSLENNPSWHHRSPSSEEVEGLIKELR